MMKRTQKRFINPRTVCQSAGCENEWYNKKIITARVDTFKYTEMAQRYKSQYQIIYGIMNHIMTLTYDPRS